MKKVVFLLLFIGIFCNYSFAEVNLRSSSYSSDFHNIKSTFDKGDLVFNFGLGLGSNLYRGRYYSTKVPPVSASIEYGLLEDVFIEKMTLGIGGLVGFSSSEWSSTGWQGVKYGYRYNYITFGARGAFHYPLVENFDVHTGIIMGFTVVSYSQFGTIDPAYTYTATSNFPVYGWYIGGRYYVSDNFAGMAEIGYGLSYLNIGFAVKL